MRDATDRFACAGSIFDALIALFLYMVLLGLLLVLIPDILFLSSNMATFLAVEESGATLPYANLGAF